MASADQVDRTGFVGREFLLWLWFESELFGAALQTDEHGTFGLWLEQRLVLSGAEENTSLTAPLPGAGREAKEALLRGQLPACAGVRITVAEVELRFVLHADTLAVSGLKLTRLASEHEQTAYAAPAPKRGAPSREELLRKKLGERVRAAAELDPLLDALYRDFLGLRLSAAWSELVLPLLVRWAEGQELDVDAYESLRGSSPRTVSEIVDLSPAEADELVVLVDDADADDAEPAPFVSAR